MPSTEVDHVVPKACGGTDDPSNLQGSCRKCHSAKTARETFHAAVTGGIESLGATPVDRALRSRTRPQV